MAQQVLTKINNRTRYLARISHFLDQSAMKILAGALIQCHYDYACGSWYNSAPKSQKVKLQTSQNKLIRVILRLPARTHLDPSHFENMRWLKVEDRVNQIGMCLVHRIVHGVVPVYFNNYFNRIRDTHAYPTRRSSTDFVPVRLRSCMGKESFLYSAAVFWNSLPSDLKIVVNAVRFKSSLKTWLKRDYN